MTRFKHKSLSTEALSQLMKDLDAGHVPHIARKTILTLYEDGTWLRHMTLADGTVVTEQVVAPAHCFALAPKPL